MGRLLRRNVLLLLFRAITCSLVRVKLQEYKLWEDGMQSRDLPWLLVSESSASSSGLKGSEIL